MVNDKDINAKDIVEPSGLGRMRIIEKGLDAADWVVVGTSKGPILWLLPGTHVKRRIVDDKAPASPSKDGPP